MQCLVTELIVLLAILFVSVALLTMTRQTTRAQQLTTRLTRPKHVLKRFRRRASAVSLYQHHDTRISECEYDIAKSNNLIDKFHELSSDAQAYVQEYFDEPCRRVKRGSESLESYGENITHEGEMVHKKQRTGCKGYAETPENPQQIDPAFGHEAGDDTEQRCATQPLDSQIFGKRTTAPPRSQKQDPTALGAIHIVETPNDLVFDDDLKGKLVIIKDGQRSGAALMLSKDICDQMLASVEGNCQAFTSLNQRAANKERREAFEQAMTDLEERLGRRYSELKETCVTQPRSEHLRNMTRIRQRLDRTAAVREEILTDDRLEAEDARRVHESQTQLVFDLLNVLEEAFDAVGMREEYQVPDFQALVPYFDASVLEELDDGRSEGYSNDVDGHAPYSGLNQACTFETGRESMAIRLNYSPIHPDDDHKPRLHHSIDIDDHSINNQEDNASQPNKSTDMAQELEASGLHFRDDWDERQQREIRRFLITSIGWAEVRPLDEWAPLLWSRDDVRADVWKHYREIEKCESEVGALQLEREELEESHKYEIEALDGEELADQRASIEERVSKVKERLWLHEARHDVAKQRARWMGILVDDEGKLLDSNSDYMNLDDAKATDSETRKMAIEEWVNGVVPGLEECVEEPELDEWDAGDELQPWDPPFEEQSYRAWHHQPWPTPYREECERYFDEAKDACARASGA